MDSLKILEKNVKRHISEYVDFYHKDPDYYKKDEGYKFKAVNTFRRNFDLDAEDFALMLEKAFADSRNLIQSGQYYPKRMLIDYAKKDEEVVRNEFHKLLSDERAVSKRVDNFINNINDHFETSDKQSFLDFRFVSFILSCYDHQSHFYVKWTECKKFAGLIDYDLKVSRGSSQGDKYKELSLMSEAVRLILKSDNDFQKVHQDLVSDFEYKDPFMTWGTWDFIFNIVRNSSKKIKQQELDRSINEMEQEREESILVSGSEQKKIESKSKEELLKEAKNFKAHSREQQTTEIKTRKENRRQKEIVKKIEDYRCQVCEDSFIYENANGEKVRYVEVDHIKEYSEGGTEKLDNLWALCPTCHVKKTLGVITVNKDEGVIKEDGEEIKIRDNHLSWYGE